MKLSKKSVTVLSFTIGACLFVSTAFADTLLGSGYDRLKGSAKTTANMMEKDMKNYTLEALYTLKDNDKTLIQGSTSQKMDVEKQMKEENTTTKDANGETTSRYYYSDITKSVNKNGSDNTYYVTEYPASDRKNRTVDFKNPFKEKGAPEIEKIVDAVVGGLKDYVQVEEGPEGGKVYSGSLSETQVPAVLNAVSSFGIKQMLNDERDLPTIESDVFVKKVVGTANENKAGYLENVTGDITLSGKDKNGVQHDLNLNVIVKLSEVGNTKITLPDLTGAKVEKVSYSNGFSSKYVGKYKNDIVMEKDGKFVKIGERMVEITSVDNDKVKGKYSETVIPGYESEYPNKDVFDFEYDPAASSTFTYKDAKGEQKNGSIHQGATGKVYFEMNVEIVNENSYRSISKPYYDGEFSRIFE
ncbi:hypothetical protein P5G65_26635 [Paenibacillus chondroitinus]|uniref:Uncharacterized protein n=1 Tax=Paenibacillus chondroitinus TaxID=59842 RepID=A0ABU6DIC0_9BACL|nr:MULTISPECIES: hypothetical protein [Paenibacillus]MCY9657721.1 hypothetical protein [Paenibacillus anseongense]MEB4797488.1 hypothetical protein [Paenibacillus chondroitinus]